MGALNRYSIEEFIKQSEQKDKGEGFFQVWAKAGSMVAYHGEIKFVREGIFITRSRNRNDCFYCALPTTHLKGVAW